ncbi:MAG: 2-C-methyl-D-erythritol 2,4-cyclodiphosphate synthase [Rhodobacteraceae bacterium]|nr:MAG: 2-C-methyl-D-erythritol 2,4-cyclodiphosphate synthase [Paracoccaceae bacterium]
MNLRVGNGFDVHKLRKGKNIILCGIKIPYKKELVGHSDADVAMHALTDSIFGALCEGDIGIHFPPTEQQWKDVSSELFLERALSLMFDRQYAIMNIDLTIICEGPKIKNHSLKMRTNIARICRINLDQVSIKGTTSEQLGFTGREEGIATIATVLIKKG